MKGKMHTCQPENVFAGQDQILQVFVGHSPRVYELGQNS